MVIVQGVSRVNQEQKHLTLRGCKLELTVPLQNLNAAHEVFVFSCPSMLFHQRLNIFDRKPIRTMLLKFNRNLSHYIYSLRSRDFILLANVPDGHQAYCIFLGCLCHTLRAFGF